LNPKLILEFRPTDQGSTQFWHLQSALECQIYKSGAYVQYIYNMRERKIQERNRRRGVSCTLAHLFHTRKIYTFTYLIYLI
jgi:hypothetical protein